MKTKAAAYFRCSTDKQDRSVADQRAIIQIYADENDLEIVRWFDQDEGKSGTSFEKRSDFMRMVKLIESKLHDFEFILVYDIDRWGRPTDPDESNYWEYHLKRLGVRVKYISDENLNEETLQGRLSKKIKQELASEESHKQSVRVRERSKMRAAEGFRVGGFAPYGYKRLVVDSAGDPVRVLENGERKFEKSQRVKLTPGDPAEIEIVRRIFNWRLEGHGYKSIANMLNEAEVPPPHWGKNRRGKQTSGRWATNTIRNILRNTVYKGDWTYNRQARGSWVRHETPDRNFYDESEHVTAIGSHEGIIKPDVWDEAQTVRPTSTGKRAVYRNGRTKYLLSGLVRCKQCSFNFQGHLHSTRYGKWRYYEDGGFMTRGKSVCRSFHVPQELLEGFVVEQVKSLVDESIDREKLQKLLRMRFAEHLRQEINGNGDDPDRKEAKATLRELDSRLENIKDSIEQGVPYDLVKDRLEKINVARKEIQQRLKPAKKSQRMNFDITEIQREVESLIGEFTEAFDSAPISKKRELIRAFIDHVEIDQKARKATCYVNKLPLPVKVYACRRPDSNRHDVAIGGF